MLKSRRKYQYGAYLFILPVITFITVFLLYPVLSNFYYAFTIYNGLSAPEWVGLDNFAKLIKDKSFGAAMKNSLTLALYLPLYVGLPLVFAAIIRSRPKGSSFFRFTVLLPFVISPVILAMTFEVMLRDEGPFNMILKGIGAEALALSWLAEPGIVIHIAAVIMLYKYFGFCVILFLAAMGKISDSLFDSAKIDGASAFQTFRSVTIPGTILAIEFVAVQGLIVYFARMFDLIFTLTQGGPGYASFVPEFGVFHKAFMNNMFGYGSTWAVVIFFMTFVVIVLQVNIMKRSGE